MDIAVLAPCDVLRNGLSAMLERLDAVGSVDSHRTLAELFVALRDRDDDRDPDVVIVSCVPDADLPGLVRCAFPESRMLELVGGTGTSDLAVAAETDADGYLMLHDITEATLDRALQALVCGENPTPQPVASNLFKHTGSTDALPSWIQPHFSPCERHVIALLVEGLSNRQIAQRLEISVHSAKRRVSAVLHKANSPSRTHFVAHLLRDDRELLSRALPVGAPVTGGR